MSGSGRIDQTSGISLADGAVLDLASTNNERTIGGLDGAATSTVFLNQDYSLTLGSNSSANFAGTFLGGQWAGQAGQRHADPERQQLL